MGSCWMNEVGAGMSRVLGGFGLRYLERTSVGAVGIYPWAARG